MSAWAWFIVVYLWVVAIAVYTGPAITRALGAGNIFERIFLWLQRGLEHSGRWVARKVRRSE